MMEAKGMINKVAEAIRDNIAAALPDGVSVDYRYAAVAAIEAMRIPTHKMESAAMNIEVYEETLYPDPSVAWQTMIDAALNEQEK